LPTSPHVIVGALPIFDGTSDEVLDFCLNAIRSGTGARVATANMDFLAQARTNEELFDDLWKSSIVVADGAPVVALARLAGASRIERTTGVDLALAICREGARTEPLRVVMYGSDPATAARAATTLRDTAPGVQIVLTLNPPFRALSPGELAAEREAIAAAAPHVVMVALGCPKQERLIRDYYSTAPQAVWIGIGGAFDFFAGTRRRAAPVLQRLGLEWASRLIQDPRRLAHRYLLRDLPVLPAVVVEAIVTRVRTRRALRA